jgi:transcription termination factor 2
MGLLATPLLRHQRRAVAWMRRREAAGSSPRGGLLADDQGLGKTFSAIALMVANRPPTRWRESGGGGTLVVCPTSVLRQWRRELASKVNASAGLRVLVHHGVGRTKLASDLARYDVVLTTFAVVALETNPAAPDDDAAGPSAPSSGFA